jgi:hypothetical protein
MKLSDFLDVVDDDDMVEVYADDGVTRPCKIKLVDTFNVSDWLGVIPDVVDDLEVYLDREVTNVAVVRLDKCRDDEVVAMRVYVEQKEGDKDVRNQDVRKVEEAPDEGVGDKHEGHRQMDEKLREHLTYAYSVLRDFAKDMDGDWTMSKETAETLIQGAIDRIVAAGKCVGMNLNNYRED